MNPSLKSAIAFAATMLVTGAVHAHDCSGGASGGMDATGNDCGGVADVAFVATAPARTDAQTHGPTVATAPKPAQSNTTIATSSAGHAGHHATVRHHASRAKGRSQG